MDYESQRGASTAEILKAAEHDSLTAALLGLGERLVAAHEQIAGALTEIAHAQHRQANAIPDLSTETARWMFRMGPAALDAKPRMPESVKDPRRRVAILALGIGEALDLWSQPEAERKRRIEAEKAERAAREAEAGAEHAGDLSQGGPF